MIGKELCVNGFGKPKYIIEAFSKGICQGKIGGIKNHPNQRFIIKLPRELQLFLKDEVVRLLDKED